MNINFLSKFVYKKAGGHTVALRKKTADLEVFDYVFVEKYHRPYKEISNSAPVILDLGANVGLTVIDFKSVYPNASIYAYEMDKDNFELAVKNCKGLQNVVIDNCAVWINSGTVEYDKAVDDDAYKIDTSGNGTGKKVSVGTITIQDIISRNKLKAIDYVKMDIEGAEYEIFQQDLSWLDIVKEIKIEVHYGADIFEFFNEKLKQAGFTTLKDTHHWSTLIAYRYEG